MALRKVFASFASATLSAVMVCAVPSAAFGGGAEKNAPENKLENKAESKPRPDVVTKKVYTNDDLGWRAATPAATGELQPEQTNGTITTAGAGPAQGLSGTYEPLAAPPAALNPAQDPQWYASQLAKMEAQLESVGNEEAQLQDFRASGRAPGEGQPTGLVLNAPCQGITTDNLIGQLDARRQELAEGIDDLNDAAIAHGVSPAAVAEASAGGPELTSAQQREELLDRYRALSAGLVETQAATEEMQQQAGSQGVTLLPPTPGYGGNMTTDLLSRLAERSDSIQNQLSSDEGDALSLGVDAGDLR